MYNNSNLVISAWDNDKLVGIVRAITDCVWYSFLADLAVNPEYKEMGIGRKLIELTRGKVGEQTSIILLSVPTALEYYPKVGFTRTIYTEGKVGEFFLWGKVKCITF